MTPPDAYDPKAYWSRLHAEGSLRSVGQSALPVELNVWLYRALERNLRAFLARHRLLDPPPARVFEVGAGTGYWTAFWLRHGATTVDGCDLAAEAVSRLSERFPGGSFRVGDVADPGTVPSDRSYDLVTIFNVLLHILDETRFDAAVANVAAAVRPAGHVLLVEPALFRTDSVRPLRDGASSTARLLERYRVPFELAGLELVAAEASTIVANNPIEHGLPHIGRYAWAWRTAVRQARRGPRRADVVGRILAAADRPLMRTGAAPSGKILLFRRSAAAPPEVPGRRSP